jgi:hypothetical protein
VERQSGCVHADDKGRLLLVKPEKRVPDGRGQGLGWFGGACFLDLGHNRSRIGSRLRLFACRRDVVEPGPEAVNPDGSFRQMFLRRPPMRAAHAPDPDHADGNRRILRDSRAGWNQENRYQGQSDHQSRFASGAKTVVATKIQVQILTALARTIYTTNHGAK